MPRLRFLRPSTGLGLEKRGIHPPIWSLYWSFLLPSFVCLAFICFNQCFLEARQIKLKILFYIEISDDVTGYEIQYHLGVIERREFDCPLRINSDR